MPINQSSRSSGFSLVEISIVLVIVGILLSGVVSGVTRFIEQNRINKTESDLAMIKEALIGYAILKERLPCPDTDGDGREDQPLSCDQLGLLPLYDLGIQLRDPWGMQYYYQVDDLFTGTVPPAFTFATNGTLAIHASDVANKHADAVAVIFSLGPNQFSDPAKASTLEDENLDGDEKFISKIPDPNGFDDILTWLPKGILISRMVTAGRLKAP